MNRRLATFITLSLLTIIAISFLTPVGNRPLFAPWKAVPGILASGTVSSVMQTHHLDVSLVLRDGSVVITKEPWIDEIGREIAACGSPCNGIIYVTE